VSGQHYFSFPESYDGTKPLPVLVGFRWGRAHENVRSVVDLIGGGDAHLPQPRVDDPWIHAGLGTRKGQTLSLS
jgi:hypothetical protein